MKLSDAKIFNEYFIVSIDLPFDKKRHLGDLGFTEGAKIKTLINNNGNIILYIKNTRLGLTKNISEKIKVEKKSNG